VRRAALVVFVLAAACQSLAGLSEGVAADGGAGAPGGGGAADASADHIAGDAAPSDAAVNASTDAGADADLGERLIFVTSSDYTGNLGGVAGANAKCQARASAASLQGTYLAWIGFVDVPPIAVRMTHSASPYRLLTGVTVALNFNGLLGASLLHPVDVTEFRAPTALRPVWTNTDANGLAFSADCSGWTSLDPGVKGLRARTDTPSLASQQLTSCDQVAALFCVQQ
jgi:hypothetical protein